MVCFLKQTQQLNSNVLFCVGAIYKICEESLTVGGHLYEFILYLEM